MYFIYFSPQGGVDADGKDDLDSGDEAEGKKIDTEEVMNECSIASILLYYKLTYTYLPTYSHNVEHYKCILQILEFRN